MCLFERPEWCMQLFKRFLETSLPQQKNGNLLADIKETFADSSEALRIRRIDVSGNINTSGSRVHINRHCLNRTTGSLSSNTILPQKNGEQEKLNGEVLRSAPARDLATKALLSAGLTVFHMITS